MLHALGNKIECVIWAIIALGFLVRSFSLQDYRRNLAYICAISFFLFGLSDLVEVKTGAWYNPWWLLVWKFACVTVMTASLIYYLKHKKKINKQLNPEVSHCGSGRG
jgi:uncharacterized membrane protein